MAGALPAKEQHLVIPESCHTHPPRELNVSLEYLELVLFSHDLFLCNLQQTFLRTISDVPHDSTR
jgi:hypothetical protein